MLFAFSSFSTPSLLLSRGFWRFSKYLYLGWVGGRLEGAKEELFFGVLSFSSSSSSRPIIGRRGALYSTGVDSAALSRVASSIPPEVKRDFDFISFLGFFSSVLSSSSLRESIKAELSTIFSFLSSSISGTSSSS